MKQASGSRRTRHFGVPRRALERTAGNTLLLEHSDAVETRLDDDVSNIAEDYRQLNRCGASTAGIVKISVSYCRAALRTDVDPTREQEDKVSQRLQGAHRNRLDGAGRIDPACFARAHS